MKQNCYSYKLRLVKKLGSLLPNIRGDVMKETALTDLLQEHDESPFRGRDLAEWLKERERESEINKTVLRQLKDAGAQEEVNIDAMLMDLVVGNLVSYTFTSLDYSDVLLLQQTSYLSPSTQGETDEKSPDSKQKSWLTPEIQKIMRRNLEIFKNLTDSKDRKPARFIVSSKEMEYNPGSCILLFEHGCDDAVCFTPPSKPVCPVTEEVKGQSVVLKVVPQSCPATVELRLLYKVKQDTVWRSEAVLKDQDTVTLTDLRSGTEYEIKCAAVGKFNYTRDSDEIRVTAEQKNKKPAIMVYRTVTSLPVFIQNILNCVPKTNEAFTGLERHGGAEGEADDQESLRIVLIGKTGSGKSATGNTILGRNEFESRRGMYSVTTVCQKGVGEVDGRSVAVVDTPGLFDTSLTNKLAVEEITKCVLLLSPGPHVFVIVLSLGRFTQVEMDNVDLIKKIFGLKSAQFSIVLFTRGDDLGDVSIEDFVRQQSAELKKLISDCGNRFLAFNNREKQDQTQVIQLLNMIEELKNTNAG